MVIIEIKNHFYWEISRFKGIQFLNKNEQVMIVSIFIKNIWYNTSSSYLFLILINFHYLDVNSNLTITGTIVWIPGKYSCCWPISYNSKFAGSNIRKNVFAQRLWNTIPNRKNVYLIPVISLMTFIWIQNTDNN